MRKNAKLLIAMTMISAVLAGCGADPAPSDNVQNKGAYVHDIPSTETLNEDEKALDEALSKMKEEAASLYDSKEPYGMVRFDDEACLESDLHRFCRALPKGAELHSHESTIIDFDRYLDMIRTEAMICLTPGDDYGQLYTTDNDDIPDGCVLLDEALTNGDITAEEFRQLLVVDETDSEYGYWNALSRSFVITRGLSSNMDLTGRIYEEAFRCACNKGILLLELRISCKPDEELNKKNLEMIREAYYNVRSDNPDFRVRIIGCAGKSMKYTLENSCDTLRSVIRLSKTLRDEFDPDHPEDFIIGIDLVNEEDTGNPLEMYVDFLKSDEVTSGGLKTFLHCGESLKLDNTSVIDAYMVGTTRAGHGFNLYRYPELMAGYKEKNIALEVCPISNLRLGYVHDLRLHPALTYLKEGLPVVICSDDGLFMTPEPLTDDFYSAIMCWDLNLNDIKTLCRRSIEAGALSKSETDTLLAAWERDWDEFVKSYK